MLVCPQGIHFKLSNLPDIVARFSRGDVNMPNYDGFSFDVLVSEVKFEAAVYELSRSDASILAFRLLYYIVPVQHVPPRLNVPQDIAGRRLFLFENSEGKKDIWYGLSPEGEVRSYPFVNRVFVLDKLGSIQLLTCSLGVSPYSDSPYSCITFLTSISRSNSPQIGFFHNSSNKSPNRFPFLLLPHAIFVVLFLYPKSNQQ